MTTIYGGDPIKFDPGKSPVVKFALTDEAKAEGLPYPKRKHDSDAGFDLRAFGIRSGQDGVYAIRTGLRVAIPAGYFGIIRERSSWAREGLIITGGVVDAQYRGEVIVLARNFIDVEQRLASNEEFPRFAQLLIVPIWQGGVEYVDSLDETERGANGFGSTGQG